MSCVLSGSADSDFFEQKLAAHNAHDAQEIKVFDVEPSAPFDTVLDRVLRESALLEQNRRAKEQADWERDLNQIRTLEANAKAARVAKEQKELKEAMRRNKKYTAMDAASASLSKVRELQAIWNSLPDGRAKVKAMMAFNEANAAHNRAFPQSK